MSAPSLAVAMVLAAWSGEVDAIGMTARWQVVDDHLEVHLQSPGPGWVAVGLHAKPTLAGARLVMASVTESGLRVEEHVARPPAHPARTEGARATGVSGTGPPTQVVVRIPLDPKVPDLVVLAPGQRVWMVLAWSQDVDFGHHSARRTGLWVEL